MASKLVDRIVLSALLILSAGGVLAQTFPAKPVRIITAGAGTFHDIVTRQLSQRLSEAWGVAVVVENRPVAALTVGTGIAARSNPDGYTLVMSDRSALAVAPHLYKGLPYDVARDLSPITLCARTPSVLVAHPAIPASTLAEFVEFAKRQPEPIDFGAGGIGTASHVANELFRQLTGINLVNVHYKGGGPQMLAIVSGEVKAGSGLIANVLPYVKVGKLKAFAVTSKSRFAGAPDIPSAVEVGLPGFDAEFWIGMLGPRRIPAELVDRLNRDLAAILNTSDMRFVLLSQGAEPTTSTAKHFALYISAETEKWGQVVRAAGIKAE